MSDRPDWRIALQADHIKRLEAENKHLNDLLNQALKELEAIQEGLENG